MAVIARLIPGIESIGKLSINVKHRLRPYFRFRKIHAFKFSIVRERSALSLDKFPVIIVDILTHNETS